MHNNYTGSLLIILQIDFAPTTPFCHKHQALAAERTAAPSTPSIASGVVDTLLFRPFPLRSICPREAITASAMSGIVGNVQKSTEIEYNS